MQLPFHATMVLTNKGSYEYVNFAKLTDIFSEISAKLPIFSFDGLIICKSKVIKREKGHIATILKRDSITRYQDSF